MRNFTQLQQQLGSHIDLLFRLDKNTITEIDFQEHYAFSHDFQSICRGIRRSTSVETIITSPLFTAADMKSLLSAIADNPNLPLRNLHITWGLYDSGAEVLAKLLLVNTSMQVLSVQQSTSVGDTGAIAIAQALINNPNSKLEYLELENCFIGDAGAHALVAYLRHKRDHNLPRIQTINLKFNKFSYAVERELNEAGKCSDICNSSDCSKCVRIYCNRSIFSLNVWSRAFQETVVRNTSAVATKPVTTPDVQSAPTQELRQPLLSMKHTTL